MESDLTISFKDSEKFIIFANMKDLRSKIDKIDSAMERLFEERMSVVERIAMEKKAAGRAVEDAAREKEMMDRRCSALGDKRLEGYYTSFLRSAIEVSKQYQTDIIYGPDSLGKDILVENGSLFKAAELLAVGSGKVLIVTDSGVPEEYSRTVARSLSDAGIKTSFCTIDQGEANKSLESYRKVMESLVEGRFTRTDAVVAVGGGVVGDLAGFVAATFMRGIRFFNIPTTLLSQIDSSIGGKTAIDFCGVKNIVGAFHFPTRVLIDPDTLTTLPGRQLSNGLAEAIKMAATGDAELFSILEISTDLKNDLPEIIRRCLLFKKGVVEADPKESGLRRVLNFGHTVGHAIEACGEGKYLHGEAVAMGMLYFAEGEARQRIETLLSKYSLPVGHDIPAARLAEFITHDKKASGNEITVVKVSKIGSFRFETINIQDLRL